MRILPMKTMIMLILVMVVAMVIVSFALFYMSCTEQESVLSLTGVMC